MFVKLKKYIALLLAVFMLLSSTGVYGFTHVCNCTGAVESFIFYSTHSKCCKKEETTPKKNKSCCSKKNQKESQNSEKCSLSGKKCCDTTLKYFQLDSDLVNYEYKFNTAICFRYLNEAFAHTIFNLPNLPVETDIFLRLSYQSSLFAVPLPAVKASESIQLLQSMRC